MKSFTKYWLPVLLYAGLIFYYSSLSHPLGDISLFPQADKFIHFFEFGFLGLLLRRALLNTQAGHLPSHPATSERGQVLTGCGGQVILWTLVLGIAYGVSDEIHQSFVPYRIPSLWDLLFDALGIVGSLWLKIK